MLLAALSAAAIAAPMDRPPPARVRPALWLAARQAATVAVLEGDVAGCVADRGLAVEAAAGGMVQVRATAADLAALAACPGLEAARRPWRAAPKEVGPVGVAVTEGLAPIFTPTDWHAAGIDGRGIDVAVVDVGFEGWEAHPELPADTTAGLLATQQLTAHGTAAAEIIADLAPGARLHLYQFSTDVELLELLERLPDDGIDVVSASVGFDNRWPADGTSAVSTGVTALVDQGVVWVGAAGNEVGRYTIGTLTDDDGDGVVEVAGRSLHTVGAATAVSLRWSEPMDAATWDLDLLAWPSLQAFSDGDAPCAASEDDQGAGAPPFELLGDGCDGEAWVAVVLRGEGAGPLDALEAFLYAPAGFEGATPTPERTLTLPADAFRALAVGSCDLDGATYRSSGFSDRYSSRGPTEDGRIKPDLCAAGAVTTGTYGALGYVGTSAATPHVAGLAALVLDAEGLEGAPEAVTARLHARAVDLGDPGADVRFGHGGARAGDVAPACGCTAPGTAPGGAALLCAAILALVRRKEPFLAASGRQG